jgi:hypothetical protein
VDEQELSCGLETVKHETKNWSNQPAGNPEQPNKFLGNKNCRYLTNPSSERAREKFLHQPAANALELQRDMHDKSQLWWRGFLQKSGDGPIDGPIRELHVLSRAGLAQRGVSLGRRRTRLAWRRARGVPTNRKCGVPARHTNARAFVGGLVPIAVVAVVREMWLVRFSILLAELPARLGFPRVVHNSVVSARLGTRVRQCNRQCENAEAIGSERRCSF